MAHYMPWYQAPSVGGYWGWHWTMDHFNPNRKDENDRREIASHTYPLTGPYDSRDADLLEYQVLLMVLSGIDGVIVDWYGIKDVDDYALINASTQRLFEAVKTASLRFAICYEDWTIRRMVDTGHLAVGEVYTHGQEVMLYLQETWFGDSAYLRIAGQPVLLTFGPQYYRSGSDWEQLFSVLDSPPTFFTLDRRLGSVAMGAYPWPPMWASRDGVLTQEVLNDYLLSFYKTAESWDHRVASAFPGFHDIYAEAGVRESYGYLDAGEGTTFASTLQIALEGDPDVVQLVTWNDYGEGTGIEPTVEFGYQYLETVQEARASIDPSFTFKPEDLAIPLRLYDLRKTREGDPQVNATLDRAFDLVVQGEPASAVILLESLNDFTQISFALWKARLQTDAPGSLQRDHQALAYSYKHGFNGTSPQTS
jgi:hypothetical protein